MYKVTNKAKDVRKFRDRYLGKDVHVEPGKSVLVRRPPKENEVWKIELASEKKEEPKKLKQTEVSENDSSSSR